MTSSDMASSPSCVADAVLPLVITLMLSCVALEYGQFLVRAVRSGFPYRRAYLVKAKPNGLKLSDAAL
jgi:hypothetical protein